MGNFRQEKGVILLFALIFLFLMSLLALSLGEIALLDAKRVNNRIERIESNYHFEKWIAMIGKSLTDKKLKCDIGNLASTEIVIKNLQWWNKFGCKSSQAENKIYYVRENLDHLHCLLLNDKLIQQIFYRVTALFQSKKNDINLIKQATFLVIFNEEKRGCDRRQKASLKPGLLTLQTLVES